MYPIYANWNKQKSEMQGKGDISNACKWKLSSYFICWSWNIQVKVYSLQNCRCAQRGNFYLRWNSWNCFPPTSQFQACQFPLRQPSTVATFLIIGTITNTTYCRSYIESYIFNLDKIEGFTPSIPPAVKEGHIYVENFKCFYSKFEGQCELQQQQNSKNKTMISVLFENVC